MRSYSIVPASAPLRALTLFAALALAGCGATDERAESRLESELQSVLGPADRYEVDVDGVTSDATYADRVHATGYRVRLAHGPVVDRIEIDLRGIRYDRDRKRLERAESATAVAWITTADLGDFLESQDGVRDAVITLQAPDSAFIRMRPELAGIPMPPGASVEAAGRLEGNGSFLEYRVSDVRAVGLNLGDGFARRITQLINPLVDLTDLPMRLEVSSVRVEGRSIRVDATGDAVPLNP